MSKYPEADLSKVRRYSIRSRESKVADSQLGSAFSAGDSFRRFYHTLPDILVASDFKAFVDHVVAAKQNGRAIVVMMGAHVIKVGLSPVIIDLMQHGFISCVCMNGAGVIHDTELSTFGETSEDVAAGLADGSFGMAQETGQLVNRMIASAHEQSLGLGEGVGKALLEQKAPGVERSLLASAYSLDIPVTIHVAVGTDIVHQHPEANGEAIGGASLRDFRILCAQVPNLHDGGIVMNIGSNVILPEVFLKALTVARNLHGDIKNFYTANFDMFQHYRPRVNVVQRPVLPGGRGFNFTGHHELMLPLLSAAIKEREAELRN